MKTIEGIYIYKKQTQCGKGQNRVGRTTSAVECIATLYNTLTTAQGRKRSEGRATILIQSRAV
jgi:hypothetical protein